MARLAKLEYEEKSGKLVSADEVKARAFRMARGARDALRRCPTASPRSWRARPTPGGALAAARRH